MRKNAVAKATRRQRPEHAGADLRPAPGNVAALAVDVERERQAGQRHRHRGSTRREGRSPPPSQEISDSSIGKVWKTSSASATGISATAEYRQ